MQYGSFLTYTVDLGKARAEHERFLLKSINLRLATNLTVAFDTELLRYGAAWSGGFLDLTRTHMTTSKGSEAASPGGPLLFVHPQLPGASPTLRFADARPGQVGPLPREWGRYEGLHRDGASVVLRYTVGSAQVLEMPEAVQRDGRPIFRRTLQLRQSTAPVYFFAAALASNDVTGMSLDAATLTVTRGTTATVLRLEQANAGEAAKFLVVTGAQTSVVLSVPAGVESRLRLERWDGPLDQAEHIATIPRTREAIPDLETRCHGGPPQWSPALEVRGQRGPGTGAYVVDTLTVPESNPWNSWMRLTGMDFFADGRAAVCTWNGDVWIVSGIDAALDQLRWRRHATGLFEPLGLKIVQERLYVLGRDQITRLHDLNGDGEADFYENFNHDGAIGPSYHAFAMDLDADEAGNLFYARCGHRVDPALPLNGGVIRVSADGRHSELFATGLRAPNGLAFGPGGHLFCTDNQGEWVPTSRLNRVERGGFYGYIPHAHRAVPPTATDPPLCWIPYAQDNSSGGPIWARTDRWGPLSGLLLHTSYGKGTVFAVLMDESNNPAQGAVVPLPWRFESGIMRGRVNPRDGQVYACGLRGWQTAGPRDGALQRVRFTGAKICLPVAWKVGARAIEIQFSEPLDPVSATDPDNWSVTQWNYLWSPRYGSDEYSVADPTLKRRDLLPLQAVTLSGDARTVQLHFPSLAPVMQLRIKGTLTTRDGGKISHELFGTINQVPTP